MNQAVEDGVGDGGIADVLMAVIDGETGILGGP